MGAVHSRSSRAAEFDVRELHGIAFRRALRKQDRRLERDAAVLRRRRGGASGSSRRRDGDERPRHGSDARGTRTDDGSSNLPGSDDDGMTKERARVAEEMRALRLECARRDAKARQRREAERERRRADRKERGQAASHSNRVQRTETDFAAKKRGDEEGENAECSATFDELLRACSVDEETARVTARRRYERERRREAIVQRGRSSGETSPRHAEERNEKNGGSANDANAADDAGTSVASPTVCPHDELPFAAAAAAAAAAERRTFLLNPPGLSRGGLKKKYEQVKVFRDGDSLFQCAFLAELVLRHEEMALETFRDEPPDDVSFFDRRDRSAIRHAETVAAVLRRGVRALGRAETEETTRALRAGAAARIAQAHADVATDGAFPETTPLPTLRDDFDVDAIDAAVVTAVNGAELLNKNMALCPPRGAPLDTWRRAMNEVGRRAEAELPEEDDFSDASDDSDDFYSTRRTDENETAATKTRRDSRRRLFESAVRNVRRAYADEVANPGVPSSSLEVAALAAHLRRPIKVIRGPSRAPLAEGDANGNAPTHSTGDGIAASETEHVRPSVWRARCASQTFGAAHGRRGRRGFAVFWELAENVPDGLPAGDFSLLLPRREGEEDFFDAEGNAEGNASETFSGSSSAFESEDELEGGRGRYEEHPTLDGVCSESGRVGRVARKRGRLTARPRVSVAAVREERVLVRPNAFSERVGRRRIRERVGRRRRLAVEQRERGVVRSRERERTRFVGRDAYRRRDAPSFLR
jgi:hypothetical protein